MGTPLILRGRVITDADMEFLRSLKTGYPDRDPLFFAQRLAKRFWPRRRLAPQQKTSLCLNILLSLEHQGLINPSPRGPAQNAALPFPAVSDGFSSPLDTSPLAGPLYTLQPLSFQLVTTPDQHAFWNKTMSSCHYLGYRKLVGNQLKYLVSSAQGRPVAALGWESCVWKLDVRDRLIGWTPDARQRHLHHIANNSRFLIFPWVRVPHLASHILAKNIRLLKHDWERLVHAPLHLLETFTDPQHFTGACYKAANWIFIGHTKGYSKNGRSFRFHGRPKEVYLYPLTKNVRQLLGGNPALPPLTRENASSFPPHTPSEEKFMAVWNLTTPPPLHLDINDMDRIAEEFESFHALFQDAWGRVEHVRLSASYLQGLMSSLPRKSMEPIALHTLKPSSVDSLQQFVGVYQWDENTLARLHKEETAKTINDPLGVYSVDGSDFPKKGTESVGVARQYCGRLGKVDNCQAGVFLAFSSPKGHALLDRRLFLPQSWFSNNQKARREKCRVPENISFKTKPQLALEMVQNIHASKLFHGQWITCDDAFGNSPEFIDHLPADLLYLADVPCTTRVWLKRPKLEMPPYSGFGRPHSKPRLKKGEKPSISVAQIAKDKSLSWHTVTLGEGTKGPRCAKVARLRVVVTRDGLPAHDAWLFIKKSLGDDETKFALSNAPKEVPLKEMVRVCSLRWPIEQCFQEGKSEIGMDHYEHRSWPAWHRHMTFVFLAQLFLLRIRLRLKKKLPPSPSLKPACS
jgi:SRSO17 transposase